MKRIAILVVVFSLLFGPLGVNSTAQAAPATELFFSEYIEGSSNNKAVEIYNGTGAAIDLSAGSYSVQFFYNGSTSAGLTINLTGTVAAGDVYVLAHSSANATILAQADQTSGAGFFNGDDAVVLRKGTTVIDVIGQIGLDPGTQWGADLESTADNTLRRLSTICTGDPDGSNAFDPSVEWTGFANDTFDGLGSHTASCSASAAEPKINEFSVDTAGTDYEYVEIYGQPNTDYSAYTVLEIEGDSTGNGVVDHVIAVGTTNADGFYLASLPANAIENGTVSLLLVKNFTGALNDDLDTNNDGTFDITPWDAIVDSVAIHDGGASDSTYGSPSLGANYDGISTFKPGGASRYPDGYDTEAASDWVRNDFDMAGIPGNAGSIILGEAYNTPGEPNQIYVAPPEACGDPFTDIHDIQGSGLTSPLADTEVALEGIVIGDFQNNGSTDNGDLNGFYVQMPNASVDADPATSEGIFIYAPGGMDVALHDAVRVRGTVSEFSNLTQITANQIWVCSSGNTGSVTPTSISLPVVSLDDLEPYEGMLVTFPQTLYISEYFNFDRFGEIVLTTARQYTPTGVVEPGPDAVAMAADHVLNKITLDDGRTSQNPNPALHPNGSEFDLGNLFRGGDTLRNVTGILEYRYSLYRIQPTQGADYTANNLRSASPAAVGGTLKVASYNVLNYFTTLNSRGANTSEEFDRQRTKIIAALAAIDADIVGLMEIENNTEAIQNLVDGLNAATSAGTYDFVDTGVIGTDEIKVAFIYKPATVSLLGSHAMLTSAVDSRFIDTKNRPSLAQTFLENGTGAKFTVVVNHLKSKGSDCNDVGDPDLGDGAGNCNITRTQAAQALVDWLATDPTGSADPDFLIIGDLNSYDKEDPIDAIKAGPDDTAGSADDYTDLVYAFQGEYAYSYVFDGQVGYLDHALSSSSLATQVTGVTDWHINADEPDLIDYDMTFKAAAQDALYEPNGYRSSDHDPVIVGLNLDKTADVACESGGSFSSGGWTVTAQSGTFSECVMVKINTAPASQGPQVGSKMEALNHLVDITITRVLDGAEINTFSPALNVCFDYTNSDLKAANNIASDLAIGTAADGATNWAVLSTSLYKSQGRVCANTNHFSLFELFAPKSTPTILPATGFAPGMVAMLPAQSAEQAYTAQDGMQLAIPTLNITTTIVGIPQVDNLWDVTWLGNSAGYLQGTAFPTWQGNTVITGHVWDELNNPGIFYGLKNLRYGDRVQIRAWGQVYTYEIRQNTLISPTNSAAVLRSEKLDWLTLLTCESFNPATGEYNLRRMVRAVLIDVSPEK